MSNIVTYKHKLLVILNLIIFSNFTVINSANNQNQSKKRKYDQMDTESDKASLEKMNMYYLLSPEIRLIFNAAFEGNLGGLIKEGIDINTVDKSNAAAFKGITALMFAAQYGNEKIIKELLKYNANLNIERSGYKNSFYPEFRFNALHLLACKLNKLSENEWNNKFQPEAPWVIERNNELIAEKHKIIKLIELLIAQGANQKNSQGIVYFYDCYHCNEELKEIVYYTETKLPKEVISLIKDYAKLTFYDTNGSTQL